MDMKCFPYAYLMAQNIDRSFRNAAYFFHSITIFDVHNYSHLQKNST